MKDFDIVIGLEVHSELKTNAKVFCGCRNEFGSAPNTNCCPVCIGLPGALPVLNKKAVQLVIKAGLAMDCEINDLAIFERKNYFYPDLAKAYQISQLVRPICIGGHVDIEGKRVRLNRIHLEEDAGKLIHSTVAIGTLVDYNRGGVPLMELVTEPDISSATEAVEFLTKLRSNLIYADVAQCKMEQGGMRCDVNVSVKRKGETKLGNRTEMKNLNSFKSVERAINYEAARQIEIIKNGGVIVQETRKWDDNHGKSLTMRKKETSQDYRYFPDPDLLAVQIDREDVEQIKSTLPLLAHQRKEKYIADFALPAYDAEVITRDINYSNYFEEVLKTCNKPKLVSNWFMTEILNRIKDGEEANIKISASDLGKIINLLEEGKIARTVAKEIFAKVWDEGESIDALVKSLGGQIEESELEKMIAQLIESNPQAVADYKSDPQPEKVLRWFTGQVMKLTRGKANGQLTEKILQEKLGK